MDAHLTTAERERLAYMRGDVALAETLAALDDAEQRADDAETELDELKEAH